MNPHVYLQDEKQIEAVESIKRVDEEGYLYEMEAAYDYYDLPEAFKAYISAGCSCFVTKSLDGDILFCRNYDFSHYPNNDKSQQRTGLNVVVKSKNPKARYKSLGVSDAYWLDFRNGSFYKGLADDGKSDVSPFVLCPMISMDGMNEKGLALAILALGVRADWTPIDYATYEEKMDKYKPNLFLEEAGQEPDPYWMRATLGSIAVNKADQKAWIARMDLIETKAPGKPTLLHPILMRMVLDNCADADEALAFFSRFNVKGAMPGADYHILVADAKGNSVLVEWDGDEMKATKIDHATNHYVCKQDLFFKDGCGRDEVLRAGLFRTRNVGMREEYALNLLKLVVQDPSNQIDRSKTQYTCIYNLSKKTMKIFSFGNMEKYWNYSID